MRDLADLFDALPVGVIETDVDHVVLRANPAAGAMLGVQVGRMLTGDLRAVCAHGDPTVVASSDGHVRVECTRGPGGALLVAWDVSEQIELEATRDRILSTISHELRTPLTSLRGFAELLLARTFDPDRQREFLTIIRNEAVRLAHLVRDFLDLQRLRAGRRVYDFAWLSPADLAHRAVDEIADAWPNIRFTVHADDDLPRVSGDDDALVRALVHLLDNAGRASAAGDTVHVEVVGPPGGPVVLRVRDEGPGIESDRLAELFEAFIRGEARDGSGLGLALVQEIAHAHEGTVHAESTPGEGATFELRLVRVAAGSDDHAGLPTSASDDDILVVGFDEARARLLVEACAARGLAAASCADLDALRERLSTASAGGVLVRGAPTDDAVGLLAGRIPCVFLSDGANAPGLAAQGIAFSSRPLLRRAPAQLVGRYIDGLAGTRVVLVDDDGPTRDAVARALRDAGADVATPAPDAWSDALGDDDALVIVHLRMAEDLGFRALRGLRARPEAWRVRALAVADRAPSPAEQGFLDRRLLALASPSDAAAAVEALRSLTGDDR